MKLKDITNSMCDVREYMGIQMRDEDMEEIADNYDIDYDVIENIIELCHIYVKGEHMNTEIVPVDIQKMLSVETSKTSDINVFPEKLCVWLAFGIGWQRFIGHKVSIYGIDFSFVVDVNAGAIIRVSTFDEGIGIGHIPLTMEEINIYSTAEGALKLFKEKAAIVKDTIDKNGVEKVIGQARARGSKYFKKFGERPPIKRVRFTNEFFLEKEQENEL